MFSVAVYEALEVNLRFKALTTRQDKEHGKIK